MNLLKNQQEAIDKLIKYKVGALFMEPGTGKTRTAYELINSIPEVDYVLYIAPYQTIHTSNEKESVVYEVEKCGGFKCKFDFIGVESLSSSDRIYLKLHEKVNKTTFIVCDESLKIKNASAKRTKRLIELGSKAGYKLVLNGTPLSRNILDLWSQFEFLSPKIINMSFNEYKDTFCKYTLIKKRVGLRSYKKEFISGYENVEYLYSLIGHYVYSCNLELDVTKQYKSIAYEVDAYYKDKYEKIKEMMLENEFMISRNNNIFLEMTQKLQSSYCNASDKFRALSDAIEGKDLNKIIVFCKFIKSATKVSKMFPDIKVLTFGKHAYGLNMQSYNTVIYFDKTFDYALHLQSERRIFRTGQKEDCLYIDLDGDIGLDVMMDRNKKKKKDLLTYFKEVGFKTFMKQL